MIKTLQIGEEQVSFSTAFAWTFVYKSQFHKDPAQLLIPVVKEISGGDEDVTFKFFEAIGFVEIANMAWAMARLCDKDIPDPMTWVASFGDDFDPSQLIDEVIPAAIESCFTSKKSKAPTPKKRTTKKVPQTN